jgi:hypothetical protein
MEKIIGKQSDAPFKFLVRPITTLNVTGSNLARMFEDEVFASFNGITFSSPITGILLLPGIIDNSIAPSPPDYLGHQKRDNSVSVGIAINFTLWERSSELERLGLLADNIRSSLDKIQSLHLVDEDREMLRIIVDRVEELLSSRLRG